MATQKNLVFASETHFDSIFSTVLITLYALNLEWWLFIRTTPGQMNKIDFKSKLIEIVIDQ